MTKTEYLNKLQKYLKRLPVSDYEDTMDYFREYFDEIDDDEINQAIEELGTPKEAASELLNQLLDTQLTEPERQKKPSSIGRNILLAVLALCAAPIGIPLLLTALLMVLVGILLVITLLLCGFICCLAAILVSAKLFLRGVLALAVSIPGSMLLIGVGLFGIGISILAGVLVVYLCIWMIKGIALAAKKISGK